MEEYWNNIKGWLTEDELVELSMLIGMIELDQDISKFSHKRIVMIAYNAYCMCDPELANF